MKYGVRILQRVIRVSFVWLMYSLLMSTVLYIKGKKSRAIFHMLFSPSQLLMNGKSFKL